MDEQSKGAYQSKRQKKDSNDLEVRKKDEDETMADEANNK